MRLDVRLTLGEPPQIAVSGQIIEMLRADQLPGREDLIQRVIQHQGFGRPDGVHLSDADGLPGNPEGAFVR